MSPGVKKRQRTGGICLQPSDWSWLSLSPAGNAERRVIGRTHPGVFFFAGHFYHPAISLTPHGDTGNAPRFRHADRRRQRGDRICRQKMTSRRLKQRRGSPDCFQRNVLACTASTATTRRFFCLNAEVFKSVSL